MGKQGAGLRAGAILIKIINMNSAEWIDAKAACALLGVQRQTLYAYVSRGLVRAQSDAGDARRSLYARSDLDALARQHRRPRARADVAEAAIRWGDPVLSTAISDVRDGQLWFGTKPAVDCAGDMTLEEVAGHHWRVPRVASGPPGDVAAGATPIARVLHLLAGCVAGAAPLVGRDRAGIAAEGAALLPRVTDALLGRAGAGPVHLRLRAAWGLGDAAGDTLRRALVLLSDHELNPSSFAVRVCASTGASLPAALLTGMATLSGPRHGGAASLAIAALRAGRAGGAALERFLHEQAGQTPYSYGFGHPLYPAGDPRARALLARLPAGAAELAAIGRLSARLGIAANIDAALAALTLHHRLPTDAGLILFAAGRMTGWIAHAIEQAESGEIIRPRARYAGPSPGA